jgi:hypothetical protein
MPMSYREGYPPLLRARSAVGTKQTSRDVRPESALGVKAEVDIGVVRDPKRPSQFECGCSLLKSDEKPRRHLALSLDVNEAAFLQHEFVLQAFVDFL